FLDRQVSTKGTEKAEVEGRVRRSGQQRRQPVLASIAIRPSFLIGELRLGKLSETVVVVGDAPHDRPGFLMCHLVGDCASFLSSKALMLRVPSKLSDHQLTSTSVPWPKSSAPAKRKARAFLYHFYIRVS